MSRTEALLVLSASLASKKISTPEEAQSEKEALLTVVTGVFNDIGSMAASLEKIAATLEQDRKGIK